MVPRRERMVAFVVWQTIPGVVRLETWSRPGGAGVVPVEALTGSCLIPTDQI